MKLNGSTGTGSSMSSIPSVSTSSSNGDDVSDSQPSDFSMSQLPSNNLNQNGEKTPSSRLSGFGAAPIKKASEKTLLESRPRASTFDNLQTYAENASSTTALSKGARNASTPVTPLKTARLRTSSQLAAPSKLSSSTKSSGLFKSKLKMREKTCVPSTNIQGTKTRLAPLNYGFSPVQDKPPKQNKLSSSKKVKDSESSQPSALQPETNGKTSQLSPK